MHTLDYAIIGDSFAAVVYVSIVSKQVAGNTLRGWLDGILLISATVSAMEIRFVVYRSAYAAHGPVAALRPRRACCDERSILGGG